MKIELKQFQKKAVSDLLEEVLTGLKTNIKKSILLESPTGSGKTLILANLIKDFFIDRMYHEGAFGFVWLTPGKGKLAKQSEDKISDVLAGSEVKVLDFDGLKSHAFFPEKHIVVVNWEKINRKTNAVFSDNEKFELKSFLENTKLRTKLIVIVDEEHHSKTPKSNDIIKWFDPYVTIRVSATPKRDKFDAEVAIKRKDVIEASLILKEYYLNDGLEKFDDLEITKKLGENIFLLEAGLEKRKELVQMYRKEGSIVNPLVVVQLPDEKGEYEQELKDEVVAFFEEKGIKFNNNLLAISLHDRKENENIANLTKKDGKQIVIITKQTITHGWDCPRAQILIKLRYQSEKTFSIQSLGRISRVPEPEKGCFYQNDILNRGYVYTFDKTFAKKTKEVDSSSPLKRNIKLNMKSKYQKEEGVSKLSLPNQQQLSYEQDNEILPKAESFANEFNLWFRKKKKLEKHPANSKQMMNFLTNEFGSLKSYDLTLKYEQGSVLSEWIEKNTFIKRINTNYKNSGVYFLEKKFKFNFCRFLAFRLKHRNWQFINEVFEFLFNSNNRQDSGKNDFHYLFNFDVETTKEKEAFFYCFLLKSREKWLSLLKDFYQEEKQKKLKANLKNLTEKWKEDFWFEESKVYSFVIKDSQVDDYPKLPPKNNNLYENFVKVDKTNFSGPEERFIDKFLENQGFGEKIEWWYWNVELEKKSWKIIYQDCNGYFFHFYPDFILKISGHIWIVEIKDKADSSRNNQAKFNQLKKFCQSNDLKFAFVVSNDDGIRFNNDEWENDASSSVWKPIEEIFDQ